MKERNHNEKGEKIMWRRAEEEDMTMALEWRRRKIRVKQSHLDFR